MDKATQKADVILTNDGTLEDSHKEIDQLISRHQFFRNLDCKI